MITFCFIFYPSSLFVMIRSYEQKINTWITNGIKLKSNSALLTDTITLKKQNFE